MNVIPLQLFVSLMLLSGSILLLAYSIKHRDHEHADRLSLLPLEDDDEVIGTGLEDRPTDRPSSETTTTSDTRDEK